MYGITNRHRASPATINRHRHHQSYPHSIQPYPLIANHLPSTPIIVCRRTTPPIILRRHPSSPTNNHRRGTQRIILDRHRSSSIIYPSRRASPIDATCIPPLPSIFGHCHSSPAATNRHPSSHIATHQPLAQGQQ